jgi:hypothetical protein
MKKQCIVFVLACVAMLASGSMKVTAEEYTVSSDADFTAAVAAINASRVEGTYHITLAADITVNDIVFGDAGVAKTMVINGDTALRTVTNSGGADIFTVHSGNTLVLDNNLTLNGNDKTYNVVRVNAGGTLVMKEGSCIEKAGDSGVYVWGGVFTMEGGTISGNTGGNNGGGVYVQAEKEETNVRVGKFTKSGGGTISADNKAANGKVAYVESDPIKKRETAAGPEVNLDSDKDGSEGGWE